MSSAELTIVVGVVAGAYAVGSYLWDRYRTGTLDLGRDLLSVALVVVGLAAFGFLLLADPSPARAVALPLIFIGAAAYLILSSRTRNARLLGIGLLAAVAFGGIAWLLRQLV